MPRRALAAAALAAAVVALTAGPARAQDAAPPTTVPATAVATVPATVPATAAPAAPAVTTPLPERAGTGVVDVTKDEAQTWSVRRIVTTVALVVVGLAAAGFVYGRVRSTTRRSSPSTAIVASSD